MRLTSVKGFVVKIVKYLRIIIYMYNTLATDAYSNLLLIITVSFMCNIEIIKISLLGYSTLIFKHNYNNFDKIFTYISKTFARVYTV